MGLKVYTGYCLQQTGWSTRDHDVVIVANTKSEALGIALEGIEESKASDWDIDEVDTSVTGMRILNSDYSEE